MGVFITIGDEPEGHLDPLETEGSDNMRDKAQAAGAQFLFAKPFTKDAFAEKLGPILG